MGLKKKVLNWLRKGIFRSNTMARIKLSTTAKGTAMAENIAVFFTAVINASFDATDLKFSNPTYFALMGLSNMEYLMITPKGTIKKVITPRKLGAMNKPELIFSFQNLFAFRLGFTFFTVSSEFDFAFVNDNFLFKTTPRILIVFLQIQIYAVLDHVGNVVHGLVALEIRLSLLGDDLHELGIHVRIYHGSIAQ